MVPVTTFHAVPVTTYQTVPVTTFQTVPVSATATFAAQGFGMQPAGAQGFGVQSFGAPMGFGAGFPGAFGAQAAPNGDFELRLLQALAALTAQQGKAQGAPPGCAKASAQGAAAQGVSQDEINKQFLDLEKRLDALTGEVVYNRKTIIDHEGRIKKLEDAEQNRPGTKEPARPTAPQLPTVPSSR